MVFYVEGRTKHELMTTATLFKKRQVEKTEEVSAAHSIIKKEQNYSDLSNVKAASKAYQQIEHLSAKVEVVFAEQIMSSPVVTLAEESSIHQAYDLFEKYEFRHVPVITTQQTLLGILSDRDVLRKLGCLCTDEVKNMKGHTVADVMISEVLTASRKTDIRYITRLFVENRIGSMPIVDDRKLIGIITRSDILKAILSHYAIELWV